MANYFLLITLLICLLNSVHVNSDELEEDTSTQVVQADFPNFIAFPVKECSRNSDCANIEGSSCNEESKKCACATKLVQQGDKCTARRSKDKSNMAAKVDKDTLREMVIDYILYAIAGVLFFGGVGAAPIKGESIFSRVFRRRRTMSVSRQESQLP